MKYYVVADPHGFYLYLRQALEEAGFFEDNEPHKLIVCGDVLDRGEESAEIVDFLLELASKDMLILVKGNHEDLFVQCLMDIAKGYVVDIASGCSYHYRNRTWHSILQLTKMKEKTAVDFSGSLVTKARNTRFYRELLPLCRDYYETDNYVFCHGWIPVISILRYLSTIPIGEMLTLPVGVRRAGITECSLLAKMASRSPERLSFADIGTPRSDIISMRVRARIAVTLTI